MPIRKFLLSTDEITSFKRIKILSRSSFNYTTFAPNSTYLMYLSYGNFAFSVKEKLSPLPIMHFVCSLFLSLTCTHTYICMCVCVFIFFRMEIRHLLRKIIHSIWQILSVTTYFYSCITSVFL